MTACRVFMVGEGPSDIGDLADHPSYRDEENRRDGYLQPVIRKLTGSLEVSFYDGRRLVSLAHTTEKRQPAHWMHRRKAAQALALATLLGADALVFSCDVDKAHGPASDSERRKRLRAIRQSIEDGFEHVRRSDPQSARVATAIAVPSRMIEAWALGDREALARLLDLDASELVYGKPEELWGKEHAPNSNHPKAVWRRLTDGKITHAEIAEASDPEILRETCPESFNAFADDIDAAIDNCPTAGDTSDV